MKRSLTITIFTFLGLFLSSLTFADTNYSSGRQPVLKKLYPATYITVTNYTYDIISAIVPNSRVNDVIYPNNQDFIMRDNYYDLTHLVLLDPYAQVFFDGFVCRRAFVNVYGRIGSYRVDIDGIDC